MLRLPAHAVVDPAVEATKVKEDLAHLESGQALDFRFRQVLPVPETE